MTARKDGHRLITVEAVPNRLRRSTLVTGQFLRSLTAPQAVASRDCQMDPDTPVILALELDGTARAELARRVQALPSWEE
jgi:hypothetical protein